MSFAGSDDQALPLHNLARFWSSRAPSDPCQVPNCMAMPLLTLQLENINHGHDHCNRYISMIIVAITTTFIAIDKASKN